MPSPVSSLVQLPSEILFQIVSYLSLSHTHRLSCISQRVYHVIKDSEYLWKRAYLLKWKTARYCVKCSSRSCPHADWSLKSRLWRKAYLDRLESEDELCRGRQSLSYLLLKDPLKIALVMNDVMVTGNEAGIVRVYSLAQCMHETWVQTSGGAITCMTSCYPDVVAIANKCVQLFDLVTLRPLNAIYSTSMAEPCILRMSSNRIVCGDVSGGIRSWILTNHGKHSRMESIFLGHTSKVTACQFDSEHIISSSQDDVRVWDLKRKYCISVLSFTSGTSLHLSKNLFGLTGTSGHPMIFNRRGHLVFKSSQYQDRIHCLQIFPDVGWCVIATETGVLYGQKTDDARSWAVKMDKLIHSFQRVIQSNGSMNLQVLLHGGRMQGFDLETGSRCDAIGGSWGFEKQL